MGVRQLGGANERAQTLARPRYLQGENLLDWKHETNKKAGEHV